MNVMFLHSGEDVPSARFRALPFGRRLQRSGHRCKLAASYPQKYDYIPWLGFRPSQLLKRLVRGGHLAEVRLGRFDVVVIDRELFDNDSHDWEDRFRRAAPAMLLDVDDGVFLRYPKKYEHLARLCDGVIAGNAAIASSPPASTWTNTRFVRRPLPGHPLSSAGWARLAICRFSRSVPRRFANWPASSTSNCD
jgi:hypothetical protein